MAIRAKPGGSQMTDEISWDDATASSGFVKLVEGEAKELVLTNYRFEKVEKFGSEQVEFQADVLFEDGEACKEKVFTTTSNRLKKKLRPIFEGKTSVDKIKMSIVMVGSAYNTNYSIKELKV